jgi:hypothetical protein
VFGYLSRPVLIGGCIVSGRPQMNNLVGCHN